VSEHPANLAGAEAGALWLADPAEPVDPATRLWNLFTGPTDLSAEGTTLASEPGSPVAQPTDWPATSYAAPDREETD
jgi:hypothetical protein